MRNIVDTSEYFAPEVERLNVITHGIGLICSVVAMILLIVKAYHQDDVYYGISLFIFGVSLVILYTSSTIYHSTKNITARKRLRILDHIAIYFIIAGTYTPFCVISLKQSNGYIILLISWTIALVGTIFKLFFIGRWDFISTAIYVIMGWLIIFDINSLYHQLPWFGFLWLFAGGFFYTLGAIFYNFDHVKYNHSVFHVLVLLGSFCHFISIYFYI